MFIDIKSIRPPKNKTETPFVSKPNMRMIVDEKTGCAFLNWFSTKIGMVEPTAVLLNEWDAMPQLDLKCIKCDNAGENKKLEERMRSADYKLYLKWEYTSRNSPQFNHLAELKIHLLCNKGRALMIRANVPTKYRYRCFVLAVT